MFVRFGEERTFCDDWRGSVNVGIRAGLLGLFEATPVGSRWSFGRAGARFTHLE